MAHLYDNFCRPRRGISSTTVIGDTFYGGPLILPFGFDFLENYTTELCLVKIYATVFVILVRHSRKTSKPWL